MNEGNQKLNQFTKEKNKGRIQKVNQRGIFQMKTCNSYMKKSEETTK